MLNFVLWIVIALSGLLICVLGIVGIFIYDHVLPSRGKPKKKYFGAGTETADDESIHPFKVEYSEKDFNDIKCKIKDSLESVEQPFDERGDAPGISLTFLREVADYWVNKYDWRRHVNSINFSNQFVTKIAGINIYFIHKVPNNAAGYVRVRPILLIHSFPTSVNAFSSLIPLLADNHGTKIKFEVVAPAIPGHGWSEAPHKPGFNITQAAIQFNDLMNRLGHHQYYVHGEGTGATVAEEIAYIYPQSVSGLHITTGQPDRATVILKFFLCSIPGIRRLIVDSEDLEKTYGLLGKIRKIMNAYLFDRMCYMHPDTVGISLSTSPLGLAAHFLEIFSNRTDNPHRKNEDGGLNDFPGGLDWLITNLMIYLVSGSTIHAARFIHNNKDVRLQNILVPTGLAHYPRNPFPIPGGLPRTFHSSRYKNIIRFTRMDSGGYFPAIEHPRRLQTDIFQFVQAVEDRKH